MKKATSRTSYPTTRPSGSAQGWSQVVPSVYRETEGIAFNAAATRADKLDADPLPM